MIKNLLIESFKETTSKLTILLDEIEDMDLTIEERDEISTAYDVMTVHGSISFEQIQE